MALCLPRRVLEVRLRGRGRRAGLGGRVSALQVWRDGTCTSQYSKGLGGGVKVGARARADCKAVEGSRGGWAGEREEAEEGEGEAEGGGALAGGGWGG